MSTCIVCGVELSDPDDKTCDKFECWETTYCHQPVMPEFEPIVLEEPVLVNH